MSARMGADLVRANPGAAWGSGRGAARRVWAGRLAGVLGMLVVAGGAEVALAGNGDLVATRRFADATVGFDLGGNYRNLTLSISGPNGFHVSARSERTAPVINLRKFGKVEDGQYNFQLTGATSKRIETRSSLNDGRGEDARRDMFEGAGLGGSFVVKNGVIEQVRDEEER
ncbi:hypothetical protein [Breoghania sp.]|uniref:hypothetical protein n=1 Tax=Breoghania sp. TaxID=2065378 RepID=UPI002AA73FAA|nr:hypothetical protein [Breoghania sp.]